MSSFPFWEVETCDRIGNKRFVVFVRVILVRWTQDLRVRSYLRSAVMKWHSRVMNMKTFIKIGMKLLGARDWVTATLAELIWQKLQGSWGHKHTHIHKCNTYYHQLEDWRYWRWFQSIKQCFFCVFFLTCGEQAFFCFSDTSPSAVFNHFILTTIWNIIDWDRFNI